MLNWKCGKVFRALGNALAGKSSPVNPGQTRNRSLVLESLEQRQLLSVVPWQVDGEALAACVSQPLEAMRETEMVDFCSFGDMSLTLDDEIAENEALSAAPMLSEFQGSLENGNELFSSGCGCGCGCEPQEWYNVGVSTTSNTITEGGTQNITFTRDNTTDSLTVYFTYSVSSWYAGDARYGVDYTLSQTGSVAFADGSSTTSITLSTIDDTLIENNEILYISLTQPSSGNSNYSINNSSSSVSMTIMDNDEWQVSVTPSISQIEESAGYGCGCGSGDPQYGEFTLSRTGQTDPLGCTPGTTVFFQMSGTATLGSDYNISREYYYEYLNYGTNGVYAVDFPTTGSVKIRVNPYNDGVQESDKTVQLTVLTPEAAAEILFPDSGCGCGCGCGNEYDNHPYRYTPGSSSSGTVTIRDDDWWKVGVATTDDTATERLYDVEQDYGEFTFTRTHLHPTDSTVEGDTTYGITVEFDMIYDSANPNSATNSAAQPGSDYALQYQSGDSWYSAYQISSTTTGTVTRYRYSVTIPYEETTLKVRLNPNFDWNDEGVLFDFSQTTQTPDDDQGENANLEITNVTWWDKLATWNALDSVNDTGQIEIKDGAICLIRTDSNNDGSLTLADDATNDVSGSAGRLLMMNNDDDNGNNTVDSTERPNDFDTAKNRTGGNSVTVTGENDLAETFVYAWIDSLTPATGTTPIEADVYLSGPTNLIPWTQAAKGQHLHYGEYDYETYPYRMKYETTLGTLTSSELSYSRTFYVEADTQNWAYSGEISANVSFVNSYGAPGYDSVRYTSIAADIDVDSNNDGSINETDDPIESTLYGRLVTPETTFSVHVEPTFYSTENQSLCGARIISSNQAVVATATGGRQLTLGTGNVEFQSGVALGTTTLTYEIYEKNTGIVLASDSVYVTVIDPIVSITASKPVIYEGMEDFSSSVVTLSLDTTQIVPLWVDFTVGGNATKNNDYSLTTNSNDTILIDSNGEYSILFLPGETEKIFTINALVDLNENESREYIQWDITEKDYYSTPQDLYNPETTGEPFEPLRVYIEDCFADLDIDSDNNWFNLAEYGSDSVYHYGSPDHSPEEDAIENPQLNDSSDYYLGKLIMKGGENVAGQLRFTPIELAIPQNYNPDTARIMFSFIDDTSFSGASGSIKIWTKDGNNADKLLILSHRYYSPETFEAVEGADGRHYIRFYVEGCTNNANVETLATMRGGERTRSNISVFYYPEGNLQDRPSASDTVAYVVAEPDSFITRLAHSQDLRAALASELVYNGSTGNPRDYCLRELGSSEIRDVLGQSAYDEIGDYIDPTKISQTTGLNESGFKVSVFQDYISGKYIIAFSGTDSYADWIQNATQGIGYETAQYYAAVMIGEALQSGFSDKMVFAGHSLGGGLASAAAVASHGAIRSVTFNAAGLHTNTVGNEHMQYYNSAENFIKAYNVDWDALTNIQNVTPAPDAVGQSIVLDSRYDLEMAMATAFIAGGLSTGWSLAGIGHSMYQCHMMDEVLYGFLGSYGAFS